MRLPPVLPILVACLLIQAGCGPSSEADPSDWPVYLGDAAASHYSSLDQISRQNVHRLQVAWTYNTGDKTEYSQIQCNPLIVRGRLYATSPQLKAFCLDAATGPGDLGLRSGRGSRAQHAGGESGPRPLGTRVREADLLYGWKSPLRPGRRNRAPGPLLWGRWPNRPEVRFGSGRPGGSFGSSPPRRRPFTGTFSLSAAGWGRGPEPPRPGTSVPTTPGRANSGGPSTRVRSRARKDTRPGRPKPGPTPAAPTPGRG